MPRSTDAAHHTATGGPPSVPPTHPHLTYGGEGDDEADWKPRLDQPGPLAVTCEGCRMAVPFVASVQYPVGPGTTAYTLCLSCCELCDAFAARYGREGLGAFLEAQRQQAISEQRAAYHSAQAEAARDQGQRAQEALRRRVAGRGRGRRVDPGDGKRGTRRPGDATSPRSQPGQAQKLETRGVGHDRSVDRP